LVAWEDARAFETTDVDIVGTRLSSTGAVLDPVGIVISNANRRQVAPVIASNGTDYLVAWEDGRADSLWAVKDVYAARVTAAGSVIDPAGIAVCATPQFQDMIAIASDGADYLLAWRDNSTSSPSVYTARVTSAAALPDGSGVEFAPASSYFYPFVSLASNGTSYLIAWGEFVRRLTTSGVPDTAPVKVSFAFGGHSPSAASNGTDYLVAWGTDYNGPPLFATRISAAGALMDTAPIQLPASLNATAPSVVSDGASYLIAWQNDQWGSSPVDILAARVGANGALWDTTALPVATSSIRETNPAVAYNAATAGYAIAYEARQLAYVRQLRWWCGDGQVDGDEACDDGASTADDGCSASCRVEAGYTCTGSPSTCSDINECATSNGGCSPNASCMNTPGSFTCACAAGYSGDGVTCDDIDECATNNGGCSANASCANTAGSRSCACNAGYDGDGVACTDIDECATANGGCAGTCTNSVGSYTCACPTGFTLDTNGHACNDVDECATDNGGCAQLCTNTSGSFSCACHANYTLADDGITCAAIDAPPDDREGGCGCRTSPPSQSLAFWLVFAIVMRRRRR
ncbi:MAG TPA: EGF domain-containing protein, partial [Kofleriaceae bacterium]